MENKKTFQMILPEGMTLPEGVKLPELELGEGHVRKTVIREDGTMVEVEETIQLPIMKKEET